MNEQITVNLNNLTEEERDCCQHAICYGRRI